MLKNWTQFNRNVGSSCVDCFSHLLISWSEQMLWLHSRRLWPAGSCSVGEWSGEMSKIFLTILNTNISRFLMLNCVKQLVVIMPTVNSFSSSMDSALCSGIIDCVETVIISNQNCFQWRLQRWVWSGWRISRAEHRRVYQQSVSRVWRVPGGGVSVCWSWPGSQSSWWSGQHCSGVWRTLCSLPGGDDWDDLSWMFVAGCRMWVLGVQCFISLLFYSGFFSQTVSGYDR